jgi:uncharacterized protein (DUF2225 family)
MKARTLRIGLVASVVASSIVVRATTWAPKEVVCPICKTRNVFKTVASAGGYIYNWPSKYQYIFWPATDRAVVYCCRKCRLSAFMWDFERIPDGKLDDVRRALEGARIEGTYDDYLKIPMSERLQIAEKVYAALERDERSWCEFRYLSELLKEYSEKVRPQPRPAR